jgi:hypothetical protein
MPRLVVTALGASLILTVPVLSDPPYAGTWKANMAKSDMGQVTWLVEPASGGKYTSTMDGQSFTFGLDGKAVPTPWGSMTAWTSIDGKSWQVINHVNGKLMSTDTVRLSPDGSGLTVQSTRVLAEGGTVRDTAAFRRATPGQGLAATWKMAKLTGAGTLMFKVAGKGSDGLVITYPDAGGVCEARFDGKDYPATGKLWSSGWTCAITRKGERGFDLLLKREGKELYRYSYALSPDGKSLVEEGGAIDTTEKTRVVYDRT